jgi:hypothetical protein
MEMAEEKELLQKEKEEKERKQAEKASQEDHKSGEGRLWK